MNREELQEIIKGKALLAPLTKGGNLPFRRLCVSLGAEVTFSEMIYARKLVKKSRREHALLRRHESEKCFGVQIATNDIQETIEAGKIVQASGADFIDINCGCPIHDATRRGLGSSLLRKPRKLAGLVEALVENLDIPVTVKIRTGWNEKKINAIAIAKEVEQAGAAVLTVHGRTREQRYTKAANWDLIAEVAEEISIPVVANGDILYPFEADKKIAGTRIAGLMLGRGALIKPWIFKEFQDGESWYPTPEDRIGLLKRFSDYLQDHFGNDDFGRKRILGFLPWHLEFFCRYYPFKKEDLETESIPLMNIRTSAERGDLLEQLLASSNEALHQEISRLLLSSGDLAELTLSLNTLAQSESSLDIDSGRELKNIRAEG